jgi:SAM-dependent methyltransferase
MADGRCALCGGAAPRRFVVGAYEVRRCARCDLEFAFPPPPDAALAAVYAGGYFRGAGPGYADYFGAERAVADAKAEARLALLRRLGLRDGARVLDVGCADGRFLLRARREGFAVRGVEVSEEARAELPSELASVVEASLEAAAAHGPFGAVTFWDVLEHLRDPIGALRAARALLGPDGLLGVVVPVVDNINARLAPRTWDQYKPPEHLWFFSRRALRAAVSAAGFDAVLHEGSAWRRDARVLDVARPARGAVGRAARRVERGAWRALLRVGAVGASALEDSVILVARAGRSA